MHDMRVALRRVEALARLFGDLPLDGDGEPLRAQARALRRRLSLLRTEEVGRSLLAERAPRDAARLAALVFPGALPPVRVSAADVAKVARAADAWRRRVAASGEGTFAPRAEARLRRRARRRLRRRLGALAALLPPAWKSLHRARIAAKRVRYALELFEGVEPRARLLLRLLRSFQDAAGTAHDLAELSARLRAVAGASGGSGPGVASLARRVDADSALALSKARRAGTALAGPAGRLRAALRGPETR